MPKTRKKSNDAIETLENIRHLLEEATTLKKMVHKKLQAKPANLAEHRLYCTYVRRILEIHKTMIQAQSIDHEALLIAALKCVVLTLIEKGETQAAEMVGHYLEDIGKKVRKKWLDCKEPDKAITKSERSSNRRSPPLGKTRRGKSNNAPHEL